MEQAKLKRICAALLAVYVILAAAFYWISGDQLRYVFHVTDEQLPINGVVGEITSEIEVTQPLKGDGGQVVGVTLNGATYARQNTGRLVLEVCVGDQVLTTGVVDIGSMPDGSTFYVDFDEPVTVPETGAFLRITAPESAPGNAVALYSYYSMIGDQVQDGPGLAEDECFSINGWMQSAKICMQIHSRSERWFGRYYWHFAAAGLAVVVAFCLTLLWKNKKGRPSAVLSVCATFSRYRYLIKQLVRRDFTTKYKRSVLGILWSLLNPILTMAVQYLVFSRLFRSNIPNFALYLLTGIVVYNGVNEASSLALQSIVGNASLITKVYVPKYIYPLTCVLASMINFLLTLIPLFAVMLITKTPVRLPILLLPMGIVCVFALALGIGMILASAMVFFRDTQFLWGVISMLWMYATPIIYPESIIAPELMLVYKCNPLYHVVGFFRTILMNGVAPEPRACVFMVIGTFVPLALGALLFKKTQDRFVLYI